MADRRPSPGRDGSRPPDENTVSTATASFGDRMIRPLADFLREEAGAGVLLVVAAAVAMIWANSRWYPEYVDLWTTEIVLAVGDHALAMDLRTWINDAAMVLFFFVVGLEIKRELTQGELRDPRQAALPIIAAIGGMLVPAGIYMLVVGRGEGSEGWAIPMATDIAIVVGVVALLGSRVPAWLKLFLLALAIVDDIGAILVIAVFYSDGVSLAWLAVAIASVAAAAAIRPWVDYVVVYVALGTICWLALHEAHVHATLAGVAFGLLTPTSPRRGTGLVDADEIERADNVGDAVRLRSRARSSVSVLEWLEHHLHPWSAYLVVPLFALANAGIHVPAGRIDDAFTEPVTWGVVLGLVLGKAIGISTATLVAVKLGLGRLPPDVTARYVIGGATLAGIGFTVSLFVTELAFGESATGTDARLGVLVASLLAATIGIAICYPATHARTAVRHVFVYGTLQPGDVRWPILAPYADDAGVADSTSGRVYDTGRGYPAATFGGPGTIAGRTYRLRLETLDEALAVLDAEESSVPGGYRRVVVTTRHGTEAWAYEYGGGLELSPIDEGDWLGRGP
jgi:NhaA family Na+:H+ antiporter